MCKNWKVIGIEVGGEDKEPITVYNGTYDQCFDYFSDMCGMLKEGPYEWVLRIVGDED